MASNRRPLKQAIINKGVLSGKCDTPPHTHTFAKLVGKMEFMAGKKTKFVGLEIVGKFINRIDMVGKSKTL